MLKNKLNYRLINLLLLMAVIYILYLTSSTWGGIIHRLLTVSFPFLIGFAIAYIMNPFVRYLQSKGVRRSLAITLIVVLFFMIIAGVLIATLPVIYDQLILFSKSVINILNDISGEFDVNLGDFSSTITDTLNGMISSLGQYVSNGTISFVNKGIKIVTNLIIIIVSFIYFLVDMDKIRYKLKSLLKKKDDKLFNYIKKLDHEIGNYTHGLIIFMCIQFFEYSIIFRLVNHPNWLLLGALACVTTVIPYFGGYITNIIAVITAFTVSTPVFIATLVICFVFPNIDGYYISPKVYGKTNNTNPIVAIFIMAILSSLLGFVGIIIAMPSYIIVKASLEYYHKEIKEKIALVAKKD